MPMSTFGHVFDGTNLPEYLLPFKQGVNYQGQLSVVISLLDPQPLINQVFQLDFEGIDTELSIPLHLSNSVPGNTVSVPINFTVVSETPKITFHVLNIDYPVSCSLVVTVNSRVEDGFRYNI